MVLQQRQRLVTGGSEAGRTWRLGQAASCVALLASLLVGVLALTASAQVAPPAAKTEEPQTPPPASPTPANQIPPQPQEPAAAKAYGVFDQACAGCHQTGRLKTLKQPAASLGNILDIDALARNAALVQPGNPDGSPIYTLMQSRAMPAELPGETSLPEITATELATIRDWITQLPPSAGCTDRSRVAPHDIAASMAQALKNLEPARALTARFISLAPLYNACATPTEIDSARQALASLINSLSFGLEPVRLTAHDPAGLLLELDLSLIGWDAERWDRLALRAPAAPFTVLDAATHKATGTTVPLVNADWLADTATRAPLYYELLGLPETLPALFASLRIDTSDQKRGSADRIGLKTSAVARGNRLIERRPFANGAAWISQEFAPTASRPDMFDLLIAAAGSNSGSRPQAQPDATLLHFDLPNGFAAYYIANASGMRLNDVPQSVLKDDAHPSAKFAATQSCLSCHSASPVALARGRADDLRTRLTGDNNVSKEVREKLLALHSDAAELQRKIDTDQTRVQQLLAAAGIEPGRRVDGLEPLPALIARYRRAITATELSDLVDLEPKMLFDLGKNGSAALADVITRIGFGPVPRAEVDAVLPEIAARRGLGALGPVAAQTPSRLTDAAAGPALVLKTERPVFQSGDLLSITARPSINCNLTVLTLDARGRATVLYPNEFDANNSVEAGREVRIPSDKAPYQFRLKDKGYETLIGICTSGSKSVDGIHHDFEKQRFTELGDYRAFLNRSWGNRDGGDAKPARGRPARKSGDTPAEAVKPDAQARTAIRIKIE